MVCTSNNGGISLGGGSALPHPRSRPDLWQRRHAPIARHGHPGQAYCTSIALAEWLCRTADRIDPARLCEPHHYLGGGASAPNSEILRRLLQLRQNASILEQGCAGFSPGSANRCDQFTRHPGRTSSPLRPRLGFRYTQECNCICSSDISSVLGYTVFFCAANRSHK